MIGRGAVSMASDGAAVGPGPTVEAGVAIIEVLGQHELRARLLGGLGIAARCPTARWGVLARRYSDLDFVVDRQSARQLEAALVGQGFASAARFNAQHGHVRQLYRSPDGAKVDVFVEQFRMCHMLPLGSRLSDDGPALPLADLMLTKLQVAKINEKDVKDVAALLLDHTLADSDSGGINVTYMSRLTSSDWGWFKTVTDNLVVIEDCAGAIGLDAPREQHLRDRVAELERRLRDAPKTLRWKARARIGERVAWREDPDDA